MSEPPLRLFDLDDMIAIGLDSATLDYNFEHNVRWTRYCDCLNHCHDAAWLKTQFDGLSQRIARKTGGFRLVVPEEFDGGLNGLVWATLWLCVAVSRQPPNPGEIVRKTAELEEPLHGPRMTRWWFELMKTGAKSREGTSRGGRTKAEFRRPEHERWLEAAEKRQGQAKPPRRNSRLEAECVIRALGLGAARETVRSALRRLRLKKQESG